MPDPQKKAQESLIEGYIESELLALGLVERTPEGIRHRSGRHDYVIEVRAFRVGPPHSPAVRLTEPLEDYKTTNLQRVRDIRAGDK